MHGSTDSTTPLDRLLTSFRDAAHDNRDLGDLFERMIANYLVTDPQYANLFSDVWLWGEWPDRWGADTGIDLVAREAATGDYWAIQCKFYLPEHQVSKKDIDTFLATSGKRFSTPDGEYSFTNRLIVSTTDRWNSNAEKMLENQTIPVERMTAGDLEHSPVDWAQFDLYRPEHMPVVDRKVLDTHQVEASDRVTAGFEQHDRGKLIMACGTGKTFTALRLMERLVPEGGRVLFLAPSISLVSQSLREWTADAETPFHPMVVCSDTKVGRDDEDTRVHDIPFPATTNPDRLAQASEALHGHDPAQRTIVFSTYQSIQVVSDAQKKGLGEFDLIICDEAHRTTGLTRSGDSDSEFVKVHQDAYIRGIKRLYMTATPRIFADASKEKAKEKDATLFSMDDEARFGPQFHRLGFGEAVRKGLLCDYRVLLVAVDESNMGNILNTYSASLGDDEEPPKAVDTRFVSKIFGAWKGLAKQDVSLVDEEGEEQAPEYDRRPMKRAIAFSSSIKNSRTLSQTFPELIDLYRRETQQTDVLSCEFQHVDGSMNALTRTQKLDWLKGESDGTCRILSNARCLSEGVDVPALDGVIFFDTRDSVVDIVQSVGRAMRKPRGDSDKQYGYIVLPVGIPSDKLTNYDSYISGDPQFKGIWKVIKALRAHDESLVDEAEFRSKIEVIDGGDEGDGDSEQNEQFELDLPPLPISDISEAVYAAIPKKLGDTSYWHDWAKDVARIAENIIRRIRALLDQPEPRRAFDGFLDSLKQNLNPAVDEKQAVDMLAQHLVTRPVFEALFPQRDMQATNPVSQAMEAVTEHIDRHGVEAETSELEAFYESIRERAELAKSEKSRQELIRSLYDSFFASAFKDMAKELGIVYTPVEIVDFILQSANDILEDHFGRTLSDENVHLLDPFTGTGTFITRLLQNSGLIGDDDLTRKYTQELHANELVLLAYYVANVNIESAYQARLPEGHDKDTAFPGSVLTDTFQMNEDRDWVEESLLAGNSERIDRQRDLPIEVIVGNPPYSVGQGATDYPRLDDKIRTTYVEHSQATLKNSLYDSYIRAIRWASDRIHEQGIVAFVTNGGWLDGNTTAGLRKCFSDELSSIYVFDLKGNRRLSGEMARRDGGQIFLPGPGGGGSQAPVSLVFLVKTPGHTGPAEIHYHDIGDYLSTRDKLDRIADFGSYRAMPWQPIQPNKYHDWLNQRSEDFYTLKALHGEDRAIFSLRSGGNKSNRDPWVYNGSRERLESNVARHISFYESELERLAPQISSFRTRPEQVDYVKKNMRQDKRSCNWADPLPTFVARQHYESFDSRRIVRAIYRPFVSCWFYNSNLLNNRRYQLPSIFPTASHENRVIQVTGTGASIPFSCLMSDTIPDLEVISKGQCHPLYHYEPFDPSKHLGMFDELEVVEGYVKRDAITDAALANFQAHYGDDTITKEGIFYYVYGVLHSPAYRQKYAANLKRDSARVPYAPDFHAFRQAGEKLAELHTGYESVEPYPLGEDSDKLDLNPHEHYHVKKMRFDGKRGEQDFSVIIVNEHLRLTGIPEETHEYVVNGKSALGWILERFQYTKDKDSGIINDPNEWSDDPRYVVELIKKVVAVSVETMKVVNSLPAIEV